MAAAPPREAALADMIAAEAERVGGDPGAALRRAALAVRSAKRGGDPAVVRAVLAAHADLLVRLGDDERAQVAYAGALDGLDDDPVAVVRVLCNQASAHRAAGRVAAALGCVDRAAALARKARVRGVDGALASARVRVLVEAGALEAGRAALDDLPAPRSDAHRAERLSLEVELALRTGGPSPDPEALARALASSEIDDRARAWLDRLLGLVLLARGRRGDAERIGVELASRASRGGTREEAAHAMALAARAGPADAWLLRWLGAIGLASGGASAWVEHEGFAALSGEPEPIGALARAALAVSRSRIGARAPEGSRKEISRALGQIERRILASREQGSAAAEPPVDDEALLAKDALGLAGSSPALLRAVGVVARAARVSASLVLCGETGSGKELFARLSHRLSPRSAGPFVAINCAAIPEPLLEAELFGHERGAFTGAERARAGLFVEAQGGTLLLDEVGEMSPAMQAKLLRVLEEREVRPVGGGKPRALDVRVLAATHRDLSAMVAAGAFREDLYYRLAGFVVRIPSLRERLEDLPAIARALLARDPDTRGHRLDVPGLAALAERAWPGNVRQLANALRAAAALCDGRVIGRRELEQALASMDATAHRSPPRQEPVVAAETTLAALRARHRRELRELVGRALAATDGNKLRAARALGISRQGLYRLLAEVDDASGTALATLRWTSLDEE